MLLYSQHKATEKLVLLIVIVQGSVITQPIVFRSDSDLTFFMSDSRLNTDMIQNFWAIT